MMKIVTKNNHNELWAMGYDKKGLQEKIDNGYFHKYMYEKDKHKILIII